MNAPVIHSFDSSLAEEHGLPAAIIHQEISRWCMYNEKNKSMEVFVEGKFWMYSSLPQLHRYFPYISVRTIQRAIDTLIESGLIMKQSRNLRNNPSAVIYRIRGGQNDYPPGQNGHGRGGQNVHPELRNLELRKKEPKSHEKRGKHLISKEASALTEETKEILRKSLAEAHEENTIEDISTVHLIYEYESEEKFIIHEIPRKTMIGEAHKLLGQSIKNVPLMDGHLIDTSEIIRVEKMHNNEIIILAEVSK